MKTFDITGKDGRVCAFEVSNIHIGRGGLCRLVKTIHGVTIIRDPSKFRWSLENQDEFCEFEMNGVRFVAWEPWGDNSRYWVGPKVEEGKEPESTDEITIIRDTFLRARAFFGIVTVNK